MPTNPTHIVIDRSGFLDILQRNNNKVVFKFGAEWCKPCNRIINTVAECCQTLPDDIKVFLIDVDENFDLYAYMKSKKIVQSIPTLLCYHAGNTTYAPNTLVVGSDIPQIQSFFYNVKNAGI